MEEKIEKVYCCDRDGDNNALAAAILSGNRGENSWLPAMMMNNGMNNPFAWIVLLALMRQNGGLFGGDGNGSAQGIELQSQIDSLRTQLSDNQNSSLILSGIQGNNAAIAQLAANINCNFNTVNQAICDVRSAIQQVAGQVGFSAERVINAVNLGDCNIIQQLKDCCCATQKSILEMGYQNQLQNCQQTNTIMTGINTVNTGLERGFSQVAYETQRQTCDIINSGNANTQRIIDTLNGHWRDEQALQIQDLKFQLSQERQNRLLLSRLGGNCGCNIGCGCDF